MKPSGKCVFFCQCEKSKERLSSVMTFNMSEQICEIAKYHYKLPIRLAGVPDLIASEKSTIWHVLAYLRDHRKSKAGHKRY